MLNKENGFALPINLKFPEGKKYAFTFISLLIILLAVYSNSFYGDWHFDDDANIVSNPHIQMKSFSYDEMKHCVYGLEQKRLSRPLSYLSFALNYYFGGLNVFGYHLVNFFIHYLAALFLFLLIYNTFKLPLIREKYANIAYPLALLSTFLWAINPVWVTSVTYIVQRMASMAGLFYIMSMYFYLKGRTEEKLPQSIVFFIFCFLTGLAALLTKENSVMLPFSILLYDLFLIQGVNKENIKKCIKIVSLPFIIILVFGFIYTDFSNALTGFELRNFTMMQRLLTEPRVILFYLSLLFYPINSRLTLLYDIDVSTSLLHPWSTLPAILFIIMAIGFALSIARKKPLISFCIIFYFLNHLIEGTVFSLELIYEHRNYLPSIFLFILPANFMIFVLDYFSYKKSIQIAVTSGIIIIIIGLGDVTYHRNSIFVDDFKLWFDNIEKYPNLSRPYANLGGIYFRYQLKDKGLQAYQKAISVNNFANIYARALHEHNFGLHYFQEHQYSKALSYFESSYSVLPDYLSNSIHIAKIKLIQGNLTEARKLIVSQLQKYPTQTELLEVCSLILIKEGNFNEAAILARKLRKIDLNNSFPIAILAEDESHKGNYRSAISYWNLYKQSVPLSPYANLALIELYYRINDIKMLDEELSKLACFKGTKSLSDYLNEISHDKEILIHVSDKDKILYIAKLRT